MNDEYSSWSSFLSKNINKPKNNITYNQQNDEDDDDQTYASNFEQNDNSSNQDEYDGNGHQYEYEYDGYGNVDESSAHPGLDEQAFTYNNNFYGHGDGDEGKQMQEEIDDILKKYAHKTAENTKSKPPRINTTLASLASNEKLQRKTIVGECVCRSGEKGTNEDVYSAKAHELLDTIDSIELKLDNISMLDLKNVKKLRQLRIVGCEQFAGIHANNVKHAENIKILNAPNVVFIAFNQLHNLSSLYLVHLKFGFNGKLYFDSLAYAKSIVANKISGLDMFKFPSLRMAKTVRISKCKDVKEVSLDKLTACTTIVVCDNDSLTTLHLPALLRCKNLIINRCPNLKEIHLPKLEEVHKFVIESCAKLTRVDNSSLDSVCKILYIDECENLKDIRLTEIKWAKHVMTFGLDNLEKPACNRVEYFGAHRYIDAGKSICTY